MTHYLNLWPNPFKMIKLGIKTIEMRLNDEKRSLIKVGDNIEFENKETHEKLICSPSGFLSRNPPSSKHIMFKRG